MSEPIALDYAPDPRRRWRRWMVRAVVVLAILAPLVAVYWHWPEFSLRVRRWYWFHQCLAHVTPPGAVLLEHDRSKVAGNPEYMIDADPGAFAPFPYSGSAPSLRLPNPPAGYMPRVWREFARLDPRSSNFEPTPYPPSPIIFLGERRTPSGKRRLVALGGGSVNAIAFDESISRLVLPVPGLFEKVVQPTGLLVATAWPSSRYVHATLQPGIADPDDPTHITIDFEIQAQSTEKPARKGTLDVYLTDDDFVEFKVQDPRVLDGL